MRSARRWRPTNTETSPRRRLYKLVLRGHVPGAATAHARPACREWFDAGNSIYEPPAVTAERINRVPLRSWKYYAHILDRGPKKAKRIGKLANDELIRPRRLCEKCSNPLPVWSKGRKVPISRKYCAGCAG